MGKVNHILLTGANGFLGSYILKKLLAEGYKPILLLRTTSDLWRIADLFDQCKIYFIDAPESSLADLFDIHPIEGIIHTATEYGRNTPLTAILQTNVLFPLSLIEHGVKRQLKLFMNTDSFFAKKQFNQSYLNQYTDSKRILEGLLKSFVQQVKVLNLRIEHVYGENDAEQKFFTYILKQMLNNVPEINLTNGLQQRDFVYAGDVANAFIAALNHQEQFQDYEEIEVGTGNSITVRSFVEEMAKALNTTSRLNFGALPTREGEIEESHANLTVLKKTGWQQQGQWAKIIDQIIKKEKERFAK